MKKSLLQFIIVFGVGISFLIYTNSRDKKEFIEELKENSFLGKVDSIYLDPEAKMQPVALLSNGERIYIKNDIYKKISAGDTLFKKSGSFIHYLIRNGDSSIFYQKFGGVEITND